MSDQQNMVLLLSLLRLSLSLLNVFYVILRRKSLNILHASDAKNEWKYLVSKVICMFN